MEKIISKFIKVYNIHTNNDKLKSLLSEHFKQLIYNITTLAVITAIANHNDTITKGDINEIHNKICKKVKKMKGGESMPSDFFGYSRAGTTYSESNEKVGTVNVSTLNFKEGIARPSQGPQETVNTILQNGGGNQSFVKSSKYIKNMIKNIITSNHIIKLSNSKYIPDLLDLIDENINDLGNSMKNKDITEEKFKKLIKLKKFSIFN